MDLLRVVDILGHLIWLLFIRSQLVLNARFLNLFNEGLQLFSTLLAVAPSAASISCTVCTISVCVFMIYQFIYAHIRIEISRISCVTSLFQCWERCSGRTVHRNHSCSFWELPKLFVIHSDVIIVIHPLCNVAAMKISQVLDFLFTWYMSQLTHPSAFSLASKLHQWGILPAGSGICIMVQRLGKWCLAKVTSHQVIYWTFMVPISVNFGRPQDYYTCIESFMYIQYVILHARCWITQLHLFNMCSDFKCSCHVRGSQILRLVRLVIRNRPESAQAVAKCCSYDTMPDKETYGTSASTAYLQNLYGMWPG